MGKPDKPRHAGGYRLKIRKCIHDLGTREGLETRTETRPPDFSGTIRSMEQLQITFNEREFYQREKK